MIIRVIDFETTGLEPPEAAVCEIGWCHLHEDGSIHDHRQLSMDRSPS